MMIRGWTREPFNGPTHVVKKQKLQTYIIERGTLESAMNKDIVCHVKAGARGVASTIKKVIDDGARVKEGDELVVLDASALEDQEKDQFIKKVQAVAAREKAEKDLEIVLSENESAIATADVAITLADLKLKKYRGGEYGQLKSDIEGKIKNARSAQELWLERATWALRMAKRGIGSRSQAEADRASLEAAQIYLDKTLDELKILQEYSKEVSETELESALKEAHRAKKRVLTTAQAKKAQFEAELKAKRLIEKQENERLDDIHKEIAKCTILAPQDGLVVYYISDTSRFGGGSSQATIAQGEPVKEGQKLMQIPNLKKMQVRARIHEALIGQFKKGDEEEMKIGQPADIRVDAFPKERFTGRVRFVANVASQAEFFSSDVKNYQAIVSIDQEITKEFLKPGMSAEVRILTQTSDDEVLTIPVQSVVGTIAGGEKRKCFVINANGDPEERDIVIGRDNQLLVEVISGLKEGEKVVLNAQSLLTGDRAKLKASVPTGRTDFDSPEGGRKKKKDPTKKQVRPDAVRQE